MFIKTIRLKTHKTFCAILFLFSSLIAFSQKELVYRAYLIGDTGAPVMDGPDPVLQALKIEIDQELWSVENLIKEINCELQMSAYFFLNLYAVHTLIFFIWSEWLNKNVYLTTLNELWTMNWFECYSNIYMYFRM